SLLGGRDRLRAGPRPPALAGGRVSALPPQTLRPRTTPEPARALRRARGAARSGARPRSRDAAPDRRRFRAGLMPFPAPSALCRALGGGGAPLRKPRRAGARLPHAPALPTPGQTILRPLLLWDGIIIPRGRVPGLPQLLAQVAQRLP